MAAKRRRRQRRRRDQRAALAAAQSVRAAEARSAIDAKRPASDQLTDISALRVSPADVMKAGTASEVMRWCIARCAPQAERKVMDALCERKIVAYLPLHRFYRRIKGSRIETARPLMVGYIFVGLAPHQSTYDLHLVSGIEGVLQSNGATAFIGWGAVLQTAVLEAAGAFDSTQHKPAFTRDQIVRIVSGWAAGNEAKVIQVHEDGLRLTFDAGLFKGCEVPMDPDHVEAVARKIAA